MFYILAFNEFFLDEYGFENIEELYKFKEKNKDLNFSNIYDNPILISNY